MDQAIRKGKQTAAGQARRRQEILEYIRKNQPVQGSQIQKSLGMPRSSFSDDIRRLISENLVISERRGVYRIHPDAEDREIHQKIEHGLLRQWLILALLSEYSHTAAELSDLLAKYGFGCGVATLYSDLDTLHSHHLIFREGNSGLGSNALMVLDFSGLAHSLPEKSAGGAASRIHMPGKNSLNKKIEFFRGEPAESDSSAAVSGKINIVSKDVVKQLHFLEKYDYRHHRIRVVYRTWHGEEINEALYLGLIVYSVETNRLYLFGKNENRLFSIIRLDSIDPQKTDAANAERSDATPPINTCYGSGEFMKIFRQMLNISSEEPKKVKIRFANVSYVREKVERLQMLRKPTASLTVSEDRKELIYADTIRGLEDFARYLRSFGCFACVEEPKELRERMLTTAERILAVYSEDEEENSDD